jgi:hypothetical protein
MNGFAPFKINRGSALPKKGGKHSDFGFVGINLTSLLPNSIVDCS